MDDFNQDEYWCVEDDWVDLVDTEEPWILDWLAGHLAP